MLEYRYDTQLLIDGEDLDEDAINDYIRTNIPGDCLLVVGDDMLPTCRGACWNTARPWETFTTSWWKTWIARPAASTADRGKGRFPFRKPSVSGGELFLMGKCACSSGELYGILKSCMSRRRAAA